MAASGAFRLIAKVKDEPKLTRIARALLPEFEDSTTELWLGGSVPPAKKP